MEVMFPCLSVELLGDRQLLRFTGRDQAEFEDIQIENMDLGNVMYIKKRKKMDEDEQELPEKVDRVL